MPGNRDRLIRMLGLTAYQDVYLRRRMARMDQGEFAALHDRFSGTDASLIDGDETRLRNYLVLLFADQVLSNGVPGDFLSVGVSYGTTAKTVGGCLGKRLVGRKWFLVDPFDGRGGSPSIPYNEDPSKLELGLTVVDYRVQVGVAPDVLGSIPGSFAFCHLNTGDTLANLATISEIRKRLSANAVVIVDQFGRRSTDEQAMISRLVLGEGMSSYALPTGQLVMWPL